MEFFSIPQSDVPDIASLIALEHAKTARERRALIAMLKAQDVEVCLQDIPGGGAVFYVLSRGTQRAALPYRECAKCHSAKPLSLYMTSRGKEASFCAACRHRFYEEAERARATVWHHAKTKSYQALVEAGLVPPPPAARLCLRCQQDIPFPLRERLGGYCSKECKGAGRAPRVPCANPNCTTGKGVLASRVKYGDRHCSKACRDAEHAATLHACENPACSNHAVPQDQRFCSRACVIAATYDSKEQLPCANPACPHGRTVKAPHRYCCRPCAVMAAKARGHYKAASERGVEVLHAYQQSEGKPMHYEERWAAIAAANRAASPRAKVTRSGVVYGYPAVCEPDGSGGYQCHLVGDTLIVAAKTKRAGMTLLKQAIEEGKVDLGMLSKTRGNEGEAL